MASAGGLAHGRKAHAAGAEEAKAGKQRDEIVARVG